MLLCYTESDRKGIHMKQATPQDPSLLEGYMREARQPGRAGGATRRGACRGCRGPEGTDHRTRAQSAGRERGPDRTCGNRGAPRSGPRGGQLPPPRGTALRHAGTLPDVCGRVSARPDPDPRLRRKDPEDGCGPFPVAGPGTTRGTTTGSRSWRASSETTAAGR